MYLNLNVAVQNLVGIHLTAVELRSLYVTALIYTKVSFIPVRARITTPTNLREGLLLYMRGLFLQVINCSGHFITATLKRKAIVITYIHASHSSS